MFDALERLWDDVTSRKMYISGGTAALHYGEAARRGQTWNFDSVHEAFGAPYQLPNRTAYNETCANLANAMWNWRMLLLTGEAKYADLMERAFYNSMLSAIGLEGKDYFYSNPLRRYGKDVPLMSNDSRERWTNTAPASPAPLPSYTPMPMACPPTPCGFTSMEPADWTRSCPAATRSS